MAILSKILDPIFGADTRSEDRKAGEAIEQALREFSNISLPELQQYIPEDYNYTGDIKASTVTPSRVNAGADIEYSSIDPQLAALTELSGTAYDNINIDPRYKNDQLSALDSLKAIAEGGGFTAADRAELNRVQNDVAQQDRGRREAILQNMQARGMGGSGNELLAQLQSSQAATDRANQAGLDIAGMAQQRALDAIMRGGELAGNMRGQEYGEQAQLAAARDAIDQFNAKNANTMSLANAGMTNNANQFNALQDINTQKYNKNIGLDVQKFNANNDLAGQTFNAGQTNNIALAQQGLKQGVKNATTNVHNEAKRINQQLPQQQFQNKITIAQGKAGGLQGQANYQQNKAAEKQKKEAAYMDALIKGGATIAGVK